MKEYFLQDFDSLIFAIMGSVLLSLSEPGHHNRRIVENIKILVDFYKKIPFDEMGGREDFRPLFKIRNYIKILAEKVNRFIKEPNGDSARRITEIGLKVIEIWKEYERTLKNYINRLRKTPGYKNFKVKIADHTGKKFVLT